jgi:hypothetical protein
MLLLRTLAAITSKSARYFGIYRSPPNGVDCARGHRQAPPRQTAPRPAGLRSALPSRRRAGARLSRPPGCPSFKLSKERSEKDSSRQSLRLNDRPGVTSKCGFLHIKVPSTTFQPADDRNPIFGHVVLVTQSPSSRDEQNPTHDQPNTKCFQRGDGLPKKKAPAKTVARIPRATKG